MPPRKQLALGIGAVLVLASGSLALVYSATRPPGNAPQLAPAPGPAPAAAPLAPRADPAAGAGASQLPPPVAAPRPAAPAVPVDSPAAHPKQVAPVAAPAKAKVKPAYVAWTSIAPLEKPWPTFNAAVLREVRTRAHCGQQRARTRQRPPLRLSGQGAAGKIAPLTVLLLHVETQQDAVRIVDVPVDEQGDMSPELVKCIQNSLRGITLPVAGTEPGSRLRVRFPLQ